MVNSNNKSKYHCGFIAIVGRPNVGKSTILNSILNKKISITSKKPQTTQKQILGIKTDKYNQFVFIDTPGMHKDLFKYSSKHGKNSITRHMAKSVSQAIIDVDLILFVISGTKWDDAEELLLNQIINNKSKNTKLILVINKIDLIKNKQYLLDFVNNTKILSETELSNNFTSIFSEIFYISAIKSEQEQSKYSKDIDNLLYNIKKYLPEVASPEEFYYGSDNKTITDQSNRNMASEIIREKIIRLLGDELPYSIAVEINNFDEQNNLLKITSTIWVERDSQKKIIIGSKGDKIKTIGTKARLDLEQFFNKKIYLDLWCKVKSNWATNQRILKNLGFDDEQ